MRVPDEAVGMDTRDRLLNAAGEVFAANGFHNATVRDICSKARANVAAINYHFGDKEALYSEVLHFSFQFALEKYPLGIGTAPGDSADKRLHAFVRNYLDRLLDDGRPAWHGQLIAREMADPTHALDSVIENFVRPQYAGLREIVADLLGLEAGEQALSLAVCTVVSQCVFHKQCRPVLKLLMPENDYSPAGRERLASYITTITLSGLRAASTNFAPARNVTKVDQPVSLATN